MAFTLIGPEMVDYIRGTVVIPNDGSLSDAFPCGGRRFVKVQVPTITSATLSFQIQLFPGGPFVDLYNDDGTEVTTGSASTGARTFIIPQLASAYAFKVRSGTAGSPVSQDAARTLTIEASQG